MEMLNNKEWELLSAIDDNIFTINGKDEWDKFIESITEEEAVAIIKWVNRNTNRYYYLENWEIVKEDIVSDYIYANTIEAIGSNDNVEALIKLWDMARTL